jgi:hypothetical protein
MVKGVCVTYFATPELERHANSGRFWPKLCLLLPEFRRPWGLGVALRPGA